MTRNTMAKAIRIGLNDADSRGLTAITDRVNAILTCVEIALKMEADENSNEPLYASPRPDLDNGRAPVSAGPPIPPVGSPIVLESQYREPDNPHVPKKERGLIIMPGDDRGDDHERSSDDSLPLHLPPIRSLRRSGSSVSGQVHDGQSIRSFLENNTPATLAIHPINRPAETIVLKRDLVMVPTHSGSGGMKLDGVKLLYFSEQLMAGDSISDVSQDAAFHQHAVGECRIGIEVSEILMPEDMPTVSIPNIMERVTKLAEHKFSEKPDHIESKMKRTPGSLNTRNPAHYANRGEIHIDGEGNKPFIGISDQDLMTMRNSIRVRPDVPLVKID